MTHVEPYPFINKLGWRLHQLNPKKDDIWAIDVNGNPVTISVQKLVEVIAESNDHEAKSMLGNSTVASVVGAGVSGLIDLI
ncbi:hypothetical protein AB4158_21065 [Vibrio splendidus]|uniref:hypothetical protein n=1 Tax=unclassified Vibrio TaxID=2614977 RepID=UPI00352F0268